MEDIYEQIVKIRARGEKAAVATIISSKGSTPRGQDAKMLIRQDGSTIGSVGGGCVEAEVWEAARNVMEHGKSRVMSFTLTEEEVAESGLICGGTLEVYIEPILATPTVTIFGAGHVSHALAKIAKIVGFKVVVIDDRETFANKERFPEADEIIADDFHNIFANLKPDADSYIVIATRGHLHDQTVLEWAVGTNAKYIGMIGSKRKVRTVLKNLEGKGIPAESLEKVHSPIGLDIGSETPEEIAISIVAELIKVRHMG